MFALVRHPAVTSSALRVLARYASTASGGRMAGQVAIVTGAGSGLGRGIAETFAREGAKVCVTDLNKDPAVEAANQFAAQYGVETMALKMDVSNEQDVEEGVKRTFEKFGYVNTCVPNAGFQYISPIVDVDYNIWKKMLDVHLGGSFLCTRACMRHWAKDTEKRGGSLLYMGSVHSKEASVLKAPYVSAKHGILGLARVVAKEGAPYNVRCNVICPGFVWTPLVEKQIPEQAKTLGISEDEVVKNVMLKGTVDGEFSTIEDINETALFLATFPSKALTGQSIIVSHGWFIQ
eukprot:TRINITY_DN6930_c0_g2_i1.p1 TRINITY_DN6930_c0_g2~~TRINITY_DN6930_c0_g2_i1.p1  ORF type:complete len:291 (-),score=75.96 TRINITY_DN6930_c0_g2_i1:125-997(-)